MNSTHWLNKIMDTMYTSNTAEFYIGLSSTAPAKDGSGVTEPTGGNYARVRVTAFTAPDNGMVKNTSALEFPRSTAVWFESTAKATYWVLFDGAGTDAKVLSSGNLDEAKTIESNTVITIAAETLSITLTDYSPST